ncbi:MAG TPA: orotidine-5'-phosphate decarboxylase [Polyangiaceae bacterium]
MKERLAFALDYPTLGEARAGAARVAAEVGVLKVGLELFVAEGPPAVRLGAELGLDVFLDLKLHDIPETVERAVATAGQLGARFLTLHAAGGPRMLEAAAKRAQSEDARLELLAVTVLTSLDASDLVATGVSAVPSEHVLRLAKLAAQHGMAGLVCSTAEVASLRQALGPELLLVTPGIRPAGAAAGDQKRVGTPAAALRDGSSLLVVGRPIRDAADPAAAARAILDEMSGALASST